LLQIIVFLDEYPEEIPFDAMKYLIAEANYGGRVTDDWDRRLVNVYISELFCEEAVSTDGFALCELPEYHIPADGSLASYKAFLKTLPVTDHPAAFGQHLNADISSQIENTMSLIATLVSLQSGVGASGGSKADTQLVKQADDILGQVSPTSCTFTTLNYAPCTAS
jgi:dynein heavy chain